MPLYLDMTEEEREAGRRAWVRFKRQALPRKRQHGDALRFRLEVFDLHTELGSVTRVAVRLGKSRSTVSSALRAVRKDIPVAATGTPDLGGHVANCVLCGQGHVEQCKQVQALLNQVAPLKGQLGMPAGEPTSLLKSGRKLPAPTT
jgi:hypothetical protein